MMVGRDRRARRVHLLDTSLGITGFGADRTHQNPVIRQSSNLVPALVAHPVPSRTPFGS
jgi:hypothetical protein